MELIYILDLDLNEKSCKEVICDKANDVKVHYFNNRRSLVSKIMKKTPSIVLFDMYSKDGINNVGVQEIPENESDIFKALQLDDKSITSLKDSALNKRKDLEMIDLLQQSSLINAESYRKLASKNLEIDHSLTGIRELEELVNGKDINISFPVALFSRYGRYLIEEEDMLEVQKLGGYFVYKDKQNNTKDRCLKGLSARELRSIYGVIDCYKDNINSLDHDLKYELLKLKKQNKTFSHYLLYKSIDITFFLFLFTAAIVHGKDIINPNSELLGVTDAIAGFMSFYYLSPFMAVVAIVYIIKIFLTNQYISIVYGANSNVMGIINNLINIRSKKKDED